MRTAKFAVSQINLTVGNIKYNIEKIKKNINLALEQKAEIITFPELAITGYPPEDLVFKPQFLASNREGLEEITDFSKNKDLLIIAGFIDIQNDNIYNSAGIIYNGTLADVYHKIYLPNYGVFDEQRYFSSGNEAPVYNFKGIKLAVNICEDIWYPGGPLHYQALIGNAEAAVNISASPFHTGKQQYRERMYSTRAGDESISIINCNLVGGQDELVFDGNSTSFDSNGELIARLKSFEEDFALVDLDMDAVFRKRLKDIRRRQDKGSKPPEIYESAYNRYENKPFLPWHLKSVDIKKFDTKKENSVQKSISPIVISETKSGVQSIYEALVLGTRDYVNKNGFNEVIVAISGGIDSALVSVIASDALGKDRVRGIYLPSEFSAGISGQDAQELAKNLGIEIFDIPISELFENFRKNLRNVYKDIPFGVAEENLQSRIRGNIVMALSNKFGWLVLTTGNKSEMSTGYATLYGDMAGGFAVIKDVLKTTVYELAYYRNSIKLVIPERIITRPPSAELRPGQKDSDSLPPYPVLDKIIREYVEEDKTFMEIASEAGDSETVKKVIKMIDSSEYKRRQSPPGIKITQRAFGRDRRMPITNGYGIFEV